MQDPQIPNLDDISKTSFYISYNPSSTKRGEHKPKISVPKSPSDHRDLINGRELRFSAYKAAWSKCLGRMQEIVRDLQAATIKDVIKEVQQSYLNILPGLPYSELPVISLTNSGLGSAVLDSITTELEDNTGIFGRESNSCILAHIYPGDITNVTTGMRSIIAGLIENHEMDSVKRKSATSLANYDINYLIAWYKAWTDTSEDSRPHIVVLLHEFEQIDPLIMQDIFDICSRCVSELPLVFLLSMTSPVSNYINVAYSRRTLSLLRVRQFSAPAGNEILDALIFKTFFDLEFQPDIMIGPAVLRYLQDYFTRYNPSVDAIFTILQLAHLKHFSAEPLAVLVKNTPSSEILANPDTSPFTDALRNRVNTITAAEEIFDDEYPALVNFIDDARDKFYSGLRSKKLGLHIMVALTSFLEEQGYTSFKGSPDSGRPSKLWDTMGAVLGDDPEKAIKGLAFVARKLKQHELGEILGRIYKLINGLSVALSSVEEEQYAKSEIVAMRTRLTQCGEDDNSFVDVANAFSTWTTEYLTTKLLPLENLPLWDIWYTGLSPFPSDIINPSIRASLVAGLLQPQAFAKTSDSHVPSPIIPPLRDLPDISILFKRYLDSSKMINVYDWFESFKTVLEDQRQLYKDLPLPTAQTQSSPRKRGKGKQKASPQIDASEEDDAKWDIHVQARFIKALHELDYLGLIKHTGRKADHLVRMLFDIDDAQ